MKKPLKSLLSSLCLAAVSLLLASSARAQLVAYDDAGNYLVNANWTSGSNLGFGFTPWMILTNGPDFHGNYVSAVNNPVLSIASITNVMGTNYMDVWGVFANGTNDINETTAFRGFNTSLGTNTFKLQWGSKGAGSTATLNSGTQHGWSGFTLRNGNSTNSPDDFQSGARLYVYFLDGASPATIYIWDGANGGFPTSVPGTSFSDLGRNNITNAIETEVTVGADGNSYHLVLKDCVQNRTIFTTDSTLMGSGTIDSAALFCKETTGDQVYNRMQIAVPHVPPWVLNVVPANASLYLDASSTSVSFEVKSLLSTVSSSTVSASLNGVPISTLSFSTTSPTSDLTVSSSTVAPDTFYTLVITARDANGDATTNVTTFNTFLSTDLYIDCGDYNYTSGGSSGLFINSPTPSNAYANLIGSNNIDYLETDLSGTNNVYRPGDLPQILTLATDSTGDPVPHAGGAFTIYSLGFTVTGEWENYTRVLPTITSNYNIYARAASVSGGQFEIERLTNALATTNNQPLVVLGRVNVPATGGSRIHSGQLTPLTDIFGNTVTVPLSGTNTIRCTAISNQGYNLEYLLVVANTNAMGTLRPYITSASPAPNATGVATTSKIGFTIANRQTTVTGVQLFLNGTNFSGSVVLTNSAAGTTVFFSPSSLPANTNITLTTVITDSGGVLQTNTWTFATTGVAGNGVWSGNAFPDLNWATSGNWTGGVPGFGFTALFGIAGATTNQVTNNIVAVNTSILALQYTTNLAGYHTTFIADGTTLTITNATAGTTAALQVGGAPGSSDSIFNTKNTNTITGANGTLAIAGNPQGSSVANQLNFQVRQQPNTTASADNQVTLDMSGLGTFTASVGKFTVGQGGSGTGQNFATAHVLLARTNKITTLRAVSGQFVVGDSSGAAGQSAASTLDLGITNTLYVDTMNIGKQKATNVLMRFNPAFTNTTVASALIRGTNGIGRVTGWNIGDASTETTVPVNLSATVDFGGGKLDALVGSMLVAEGATTTGDTGFANGTVSLTAGTLDVNNLKIGTQRAVNAATVTGVVNLNGTATLASTNITLAAAAAGANAALVSGTINVTNGTVRGNINAGGGVSTVNLKSGTLMVSNNVGSASAPLTALNLSAAALHFRADGNATTAFIYASSVGGTGTSTITIDSVTNVTSTQTNHLISYAGTTPFARLSLAPLPSGYAGSLADSGTSIDLIMNVSVVVSKPPTIRNITITGGQIILSGTNNAGAGGTYSVLTTTNLTVPFTNWMVLTSGTFDANGNFSSTNATGTNSQQFYRLKVP